MSSGGDHHGGLSVKEVGEGRALSGPETTHFMGSRTAGCGNLYVVAEEKGSAEWNTGSPSRALIPLLLPGSKTHRV